MTASQTEPQQRPPTPDLHAFEHHWQDEADAAYLYRLLSAAEPDVKKKDLYQRLAEVEDRHVEIWANLLAQYGRPVGSFRPSARTRLLAGLGRVFGPGFLLPMLLAEEGREVKGYLDMHRRTAKGAPGASESLLLARESAEHATTLNTISGRTGEPWHRAEAGGLLRNVVYGFNDGLTANFGLVGGVIGATAAAPDHAIIVARGAPAPRDHRRRRRRGDRRRALDGLERLSRRQERAGGLRQRDRDGARRD